ncbi:hypothetical protein GBF38_020715 [Nibea albiflora]|uniref:Uncharacterized protein n=1 Tax=Nibea albiflora TaxID=240163 RepID=A0ACB7FFL4_NIBAL|nr:hypothetical protein GBF38_020715 [Nibea albiflora]
MWTRGKSVPLTLSDEAEACEQMCGFIALLKGDSVLFSSQKVERRMRVHWEHGVPVHFFPLPKEETDSVRLFKRQRHRGQRDDILTAAKNSDRSETEQNQPREEDEE